MDAIQDGALAKLQGSGTPSDFLGASGLGRHSFGYFSFAVERKVPRPRVREPASTETPV